MAAASSPTEFVTLREAARRVGVHPKTIYRARDTGELATYRVGARWQRVAWRDVVAWVMRRPVATEPRKEPTEANGKLSNPLH